jgi:hypothetical protein
MTFAEIDNLEPWLDQSARRNRWAAPFAAASAVLAGIATLCGMG